MEEIICVYATPSERDKNLKFLRKVMNDWYRFNRTTVNDKNNKIAGVVFNTYNTYDAGHLVSYIKTLIEIGLGRTLDKFVAEWTSEQKGEQ